MVLGGQGHTIESMNSVMVVALIILFVQNGQ